MPASDPEKRLKRKETFLQVYKATYNKSKAIGAINANRSTVWRWTRDDNEFRDKLLEIEESWIDLAESELLKQVKSGNLSAVKFLLKSRGKLRGYAPSLSIEKNVTEERIDTKRIEILMADVESRQALEILAQSILAADKNDEKDITQFKKPFSGILGE